MKFEVKPQEGGGGRLKQLQKCRGDPKKGRICKKGGMLLVWVFFSSWGLANVTIVTFNYILVIVLLFPLNVGVSTCFHCTVLVSVTGHVLPICIMQVLLLVSV